MAHTALHRSNLNELKWLNLTDGMDWHSFFDSMPRHNRAILFNTDYSFASDINLASVLDALYGNGLITSLFHVAKNEFTSEKPLSANTHDEFVKLYLKPFLRNLSIMNSNELYEWVFSLYNSNPDGIKILIQRAFSSLLENEKCESKAIASILDLMCNFDYEELKPIGIVVASAAMALHGDDIKSKVVDLLGHWGNKEAYNLIKKLETPSSFIVRLKLDSLKNSFAKKYEVHTENK